jgi:predicted hotdog family 3-hydroxylacyl-ACP dehydratase
MTTPGRLVLTSVLVIVGAVCFGLIATGAEQSRERAVRAARTGTEPLLVQALNLYTALSDANATVATGLLAGGLEPPAKRARYLHDLRTATRALTALAREAGSSAAASAALGTVANQLPVYSGLVETARANNRQGFPIGAAYLRQAAGLLTSTVLPAAEHLDATEAERLNDDYRTGTSSASLIALVAASVLAIALLLLAQLMLTRMSRRILNVPMALATVALVAVSAWAVIGVITEQDALAAAQRDGSDSVELLSAAGVLLSRAQGDLSLALVNRGTDVTDGQDLATVERVLAKSVLARRLGVDFPVYQSLSNQVGDLEGNGQFGQAIALEPAASKLSDTISNHVATEIAAAHASFTRSTADAGSALSALGLAIPLLTAVSAALALLGLRLRINEYR